MKKEDLRRLCRERSIAYTSKDTVSTLRALLDSANENASTSTSTHSVNTSSISVSAPPAVTVPTGGVGDNTSLVNAFVSALQQAGLARPPTVDPVYNTTGINTADKEDHPTGDDASLFSEVSRQLPANSRKRHVSDAHPLQIESSRPQGKPIALDYSLKDGVRRAVLEGAFVPIYKLLPGYDSYMNTGAIHMKSDEDGTVRLSAGDTNAEKKLARKKQDLPTLLLGLMKYKEIVGENSPSKSNEIDAYMANLITISQKFPGGPYWEYHCYFWNRVFSSHGHFVSWYSIDPEALHMALAACDGAKPVFCSFCQNNSHATARCPFSLQSVAPTTNITGQCSSNKSIGGELHFHKGKEICTRFNRGECVKSNCSALHMCIYCNSFRHPLSKCPDAPKNLKSARDEFEF